MGVRVAGASRSAGAWSALLAELADHLDGVETVAELRSVGRRAARLLDADDVAIMRVTGDGRLVELLSDHSVNHAGSRWLLEDFPATRHLIERGEVGQIVAGDDAVDPVEQEELTGLGFQAMLIVPAPLGAAGSALIEVYRVRPRAFTRAEIERARVVALQLRAVLVRL
jgi:hypothetical protein